MVSSAQSALRDGDESMKMAIYVEAEGHSKWVYGVTVTTDGQQAISASGDGTVKRWDLETGRALRTLQGHTVGSIA